MWHNYVLETLDSFEIPHEQFYYEDFLTDFKYQSRSMLDFFEVAPEVNIENNTKVDPLRLWKSNLMKTEDRVKVKSFIEAVASNRTLKIVERYLVDF